MNKILAFLLLYSLSFRAEAQLLNGGFETKNSGDYANFWAGKLYQMEFTLDSFGNFHSDSIIGDKSLFSINTTNPYSGTNALELRNAYNYSKQMQMPGMVFASNDTSGYTGFGNTVIQVSDQPDKLEFYYLFKRVNTDIAYASITVYDDAMNEIGKGEIQIQQSNSTYTKAIIPVTYTSSAKAAFAEIVFSTTIVGGVASLGTSILIDEVSISYATQVNGYNTNNTISVFPNPAHSGQEIQIVSKQNKTIENAYLYDVSGKLFKIEATIGGYTILNGNLNDGIYILVVNMSGGQVYKVKMVIRP